MMMVYFNYLLETSVCIAVLYAFFHFMMQHEKLPLLNRIYLLSALVIAVVIPFLNIVIPVSTPEYINDFTFSEGLIVIAGEQEVVSTTFVENNTTALSFWTLENILLIIYLLGVLFFAFRLLRNVFQIFQLISKYEKTQFSNYTLVLVDKKIPVFSFWNYIFLSKSNTYSNREKEVIIAHEIAHVQERHTVDVLLIEFVKILIWFNPIIHIYQKKLKEIHEYLADEAVLKGNCTLVQYASLMMQEARKHTPHMLPVTHFFHNQLKNRLIMLSKVKKRERGFKTFLSLPIVLLLFVAFSMNGELFGQQKEGKEAVIIPTIPSEQTISQADTTRPQPPAPATTIPQAPSKIRNGTATAPEPPKSPKPIEGIPQPPTPPAVKPPAPPVPAVPKIKPEQPKAPLSMSLQTPSEFTELVGIAKPGKCYSSKCVNGDKVTEKWFEVVCPKDVTVGLILTIQDRLEKRGYKTGEAPQRTTERGHKKLDDTSKASLIQFQKANNLPEGQLDMETMKQLNVEIDC